MKLAPYESEVIAALIFFLLNVRQDLTVTADCLAIRALRSSFVVTLPRALRFLIDRMGTLSVGLKVVQLGPRSSNSQKSA